MTCRHAQSNPHVVLSGPPTLSASALHCCTLEGSSTRHWHCICLSRLWRLSWAVPPNHWVPHELACTTLHASSTHLGLYEVAAGLQLLAQTVRHELRLLLHAGRGKAVCPALPAALACTGQVQKAWKQWERSCSLLEQAARCCTVLLLGGAGDFLVLIAMVMRLAIK